MATALGVIAIIQGPKLQGWQFDAETATAGPGQQLHMTLNETITQINAEQVTVAPHVGVSIQTQGSVAIIRFTSALHNATHYRIDVRGVRSAHGGPASDLRLQVTTPPFSFIYLHRGATDAIMSVTAGKAPKQLYAAQGIESFTRTPSGLVLARTTPDEQSALSVVHPGSPRQRALKLPDSGRIGALTSIGNRVVFTLTSHVVEPTPRYDQTLFSLDLDGDGAAKEVTGLSGQSLSIESWIPVPGTTAVILLSIDGSLLRYDPFTTPPIAPLGAFLELGGLSPDQSRLGVSDAIGAQSVDLSTRKHERIASPLIDGHATFADAPTPVTAATNILRLSLSPDKQGGLPGSELVRSSTSVTTLFHPAGKAPLIIDYQLTSNGQYVVVEFITDQLDYDPDDSPVNFRPKAIQIAVVDATTGKQLLEVPGFDASWPS